jgi:hypothetical protein
VKVSLAESRSRTRATNQSPSNNSGAFDLVTSFIADSVCRRSVYFYMSESIKVSAGIAACGPHLILYCAALGAAVEHSAFAGLSPICHQRR